MKKVISREIYFPDDKVETAREDLIRLYDPNSMCYNDGYYAKSLVQKYGMSVSDLESLVGKPKMNTTWSWE